MLNILLITDSSDCNETINETDLIEELVVDDNDGNDGVSDDESSEEEIISGEDETETDGTDEEVEEENVEETIADEPEVEKRIKMIQNSCRNVVSKLRCIVKKYNRSNPLRLYVEHLKTEKEINQNLYHDFQVRWNTTYVMLDRSLKLKPVINEITHNSYSIPNLTVKSFSHPL